MPEYDFVESTGVILVDTSDTLTTVQDEYKVAFNDSNLVVDSGPMSVLINAEAEQRDLVARNNADLANQINPNVAGGIFLDSLYALFNGQRTPGTFTTVTATITGVAATFIAEGAAALSDDGDRFISTGDVTIPGGGSITATFRAENEGPIVLSANGLTKILDSVLGWETIDNVSAGVTGRDDESDADAQNRRSGLIAIQSISMSTAIISRVLAVSGVTSVIFRDNVTGSQAVIDGLTLEANSVYVGVSGGLDSEIAQALVETKTGGADWTGTETEIVVDSISGQSYTVRFNRATAIVINIQITISPDVAVSDPASDTADAVLAYAAGNISGFAGFIDGADVEPFDISDGVNTLNSSLNVKRVEVRLDGVPPFSADDIPIALDEIATIINTDITVLVV